MSRRPGRARARTLAAAALGLAAVGVLLVLALGAREDTPALVAEFTSSRGLVERAEVRVGGAPAGSVTSIRLSDRGTAEVGLDLHDGLPRLAADATAAIRPVDLLGDVYVELSPGTSDEPLRGPIPVSRTSNAPRLDELLATFDAPVRAGLQALLAESGRALGTRGAELGRAAVELRPALRAADGVLDELGDQNAALGDLVADTERTVGGLVPRVGDVAGTVAGLDRLLAATDAGRADLDRGLRALPATLDRIGSTARELDRAAGAATPVARELRAAAPPLAGALRELPPFLGGLRRASGDLRPTLAALRTTLVRGAPALRSLSSGLASLTDIAPELDGLAAIVQKAAPDISEGFFVNFADQGAEPGTQPFDPLADRRRNYWRGAAVLSCEAFGVKVEPGCLTRFLGPATADDDTARRGRGSRPARPAATPAAPVRTPAVPPAPAAPAGLPSLLPDVQQTVRELLQPTAKLTGDLLGRLGGKR